MTDEMAPYLVRIIMPKEEEKVVEIFGIKNRFKLENNKWRLVETEKCEV